jgi:NADH-quinone oxidoreductase subunit N
MSLNAIPLLPFLILFGAPVVLLGLIAVRRSFGLTGGASIVLLACALASIVPAARAGRGSGSPLFALDGFTYYFLGLLLAAGIVIALTALRYFHRLEDRREEFFALFVLAIFGAAVVVASRHFVSFFLGLEILSVSLYALIAYPRGRSASIEAGLKYLVLAAVSAAFLVLGLAFLYFEFGTLSFEGLSMALLGGGGLGIVSLAGLGLVLVGVGFKLALVPFHMWTPDVYQGAPAPVTSFVASISKGALFAFLLRFFGMPGATGSPTLRFILFLIAAASMFTGNLLALAQKNIKRLLAYSSIAHLGYLLIAFLAAGDLGLEAAAFYLAAYFVTIIGAFAVVGTLSPTDRDADEPGDYAGLFWRRPFTALVLTAMLLSLAGIPLTAGFVGKFYLVAAGTEAGLWALVFILIGNSVLSLYYYLRVIVTLYSPSEPAPPAGRKVAAVFSLAAGLALVVLLVALVWLGVVPSGLIRLIRDSISTVVAAF